MKVGSFVCWNLFLWLMGYQWAVQSLYAPTEKKVVTSDQTVNAKRLQRQRETHQSGPSQIHHVMRTKLTSKGRL